LSDEIEPKKIQGTTARSAVLDNTSIGYSSLGLGLYSTISYMGRLDRCFQELLYRTTPKASSPQFCLCVRCVSRRLVFSLSPGAPRQGRPGFLALRIAGRVRCNIGHLVDDAIVHLSSPEIKKGPRYKALRSIMYLVIVLQRLSCLML